jgi:Protein of unknown function (DUF3027)
VSSTTRTRPPTLDAACASAIELAQAAAVEEAGDEALVGDYLGCEADSERVVTHYFDCRSPAYRGWRWAATVARAARSRVVTVDEAVLLPGATALLAPQWLPWSSRLRPGDLGVGDLLPTPADDERLTPGYSATGDEEADRVAIWELGLGRPRVLSRIGRAEAAQRWHEGDSGPRAPIAEAAPANCGTCGFYLVLGGSMRAMFGVCANEYAPDDGRVVSVDHGCGAHSEALVTLITPDAVAPVVDEFGYDIVAEAGIHAEAVRTGSVSDATPAEDLGHS